MLKLRDFRQSSRLYLKFSVLGTLAGLAACSLSTSNPSNLDETPSRNTGEDFQSEKATDFWTPERIEEALSNPLLLAELPAELSDRLPVAGPAPEKSDTPPINVNTQNYPYRTIGKLIFTTPDGKMGSCSAQFVGPKRNGLVTAGHCIYDASVNKWHKNLSFVRAAGGTEQEIFDIFCKTRFIDYHDNPSGWVRVAADVGILETKRPYKGQLGMASLKSAPIEAVGYPSQPGDGKFLYSVTGKFLSRQSGDRVQAMSENALIFGASGGAWIQDLHLVGINSYAYTPVKMVLSPMITNNVVKLYENGTNGKCGDGHQINHR